MRLMDLMNLSIDAAKLRKAREDAGLSQDAAADLVGVKKAAVSKYELGLCLPSAEVLARLCAAYGIELSALITEAQAA